MSDAPALDRQIRRQRAQILVRTQRALEKPMLLLALAWLVLFVLEVTRGLTPAGERLGLLLWAVFVLEFALGALIAPDKLRFLRRNWLSALSLLAPALRIARLARVLRVSRLARATRGARLLRVLSSVNRGMKALGRSMRRRGMGYVASLSLLVVLAGAAGMYGLEPATPDGRGFASYGDAVWWTAMVVTTMGSQYWPYTPAARALCFLLSLYGVGMLGYVAASLATFFIGRDAASPSADVAGAREVENLRREVERLRGAIERTPGP